MNKLTTAILLTACAASSMAKEEKKPWVVDVDIGAIATSGNTDTTSLQFKVDAKQNLEKWENQYVFNSLFKEDSIEQEDGTNQREKTAEKYFGSAKFAYLIGVDESYLFGYGSHTNDKFGAYRTYSTVALGYGNWLYYSPTFNWFVEAGPGYFEGEKVVESDDPLLADTLFDESGAMLRAATALEWKISDSATFKQLVSVESGEDNTRTQSETSLSTSINKSMKMKVGVAIANDSDVAPGKEKTDTTTFINLVYSF